MATFDDVRRLGGRLPKVEEGTSYDTSALKVGGKGVLPIVAALASMTAMACTTPRVLVVFCGLEEKELLLANAGGVLFSTPHHAG